MTDTISPQESPDSPASSMPPEPGTHASHRVDVAARNAKRLYESARTPVIFAVAAVVAFSLPFIPRGAPSPLAHLLMVMLVLRLVFLGLTSPRADLVLTPVKRGMIAVAAMVLALLSVDRVPDFYDVGQAWPFMCLAFCALAALSRHSQYSAFVAIAGLDALLVFLIADSPWPGIAAMTATFALTQFGFLSKLRGERQLHPTDRIGTVLLAGLAVVTLIVAVFWFPNLNFDGPDRNDRPEQGELGGPEGGVGRDGGGAGSGSAGGGGAGGGGLGGQPGGGAGGSGGGYQPSPDGSVIFVPLEPGQPIPPGTVLVEEPNGGLGSPEGNGFITCVDGVLTYEEVPRFRRFATDRYGDGRILECTDHGLVKRELGAREVIPEGAIEIRADDGAFDQVPRTRPESDDAETDPFSLPNLPWLWILAGLLMISAAATAAFYYHRWSQVPWITKALGRLDRIGSTYNRKLRIGESLSAFATRLPETARPLAGQIATELDGFAFSGRYDPGQNPADPPADVRGNVDNLLSQLKTQAQIDRRERRRHQLRGALPGRRSVDEGSSSSETKLKK